MRFRRLFPGLSGLWLALAAAPALAIPAGLQPIVAVPEPVTALMLGGGLVGLAVFGRKRG